MKGILAVQVQLRRLASGVCLAMTASALAMIGGPSPVAAGGGVIMYHAFLYSAGTMTDLGSVPGADQSMASDINDVGQVVGSSFNDTGFSSAYVWSAATGMRDLNTLLPSNSGWVLQDAAGINNSGQVIGLGMIGGQVQHAYLLTPPAAGVNASIVDLGALFTPEAINNAGQVAGTDDAHGVAAIYSAGTFTDLGTLPGGFGGGAFDVNDSSQVAGDASVPAPPPVNQEDHAVLYSGGAIVDLGAGDALGINDLGQVVGTSKSFGHAFLYSAGTITDLGTLPNFDFSQAQDINETEQIVGYAGVLAGGDLHGFLYRAGTMTDLGALPGQTNSLARRINAGGQVVGTSWGATTVTTNSMRQAINQFLASGLIKNAGIANSLIAKLNAVDVARAIGDCITAANIAQAFIHELQAQVGKSVDAAAGSTLIADAKFLIANCP
ncbi:MAG: hypothetical protein E6I84_02410 [Chloroflexi bacterium]|nr:MAG: hypothetical protein E6I84_02410 [Chloroflexota bacterium]